MVVRTVAELVLVHADLVVDQVQAPGELADLSGHVRPVPAQEREPGLLVAGALSDEVIIGPRTMEQLDDLLKGASLTLDDAALDRIDEIVPPGTNVYQPDGAWRPPILADAARRRRPPAAPAGGSRRRLARRWSC